MNIATLDLPDVIGLILGFTFTLLVFSYLLGDNPLFRITLNIFIGATAGYAGAVTFYSVILPRLILPLIGADRGERVLAVVPLLLSGLLLTKMSPRLSRWGNLSMAYLVGVGAAAAIGGAVMGTLFPQVGASINLFDRGAAAAAGENVWIHLVNAVIVLVGTISTLAYFHFGVRSRANQPPERPMWIERLGQIGQVFVAIAFGVLFAGVYAASLVALIERLSSLINLLRPLMQPLS